MTKREYMNFMEEVAQTYILDAKDSLKRNMHMNRLKDTDKLKDRVIEAVLIDFINTVGLAHGLDEGYNVKDLYGTRNLYEGNEP